MKSKETHTELVRLEDIQVHKLAEIHRVMSELEFESLKDSIQENGQLVPVITYKGKIVDGRHRFLALTALGETHIRVDTLPGNISLAEVRKRVQGTEMRRTDNNMQKAIRAYKDIAGGNGLTQDETATKFGVTRDKISQAKKLNNMRGIEFLEELYLSGKVLLGGKTFTQLRQIIKFFENVKAETDRNYPAPTEILAEHYRTIKDLTSEELILLSIRCKHIINRREGE